MGNHRRSASRGSAGYTQEQLERRFLFASPESLAKPSLPVDPTDWGTESASLHAIDSATQLLRQKVLAAAGLTATDAERIQADKPNRAAQDSLLTLDDTNYWSSLPLSSAQAITPAISAVNFQSAELNIGAISNSLSLAPADGSYNKVADLPVLMLPTPDGGVARFGIEHYDLLAPSVAAQFPDIRSVRAYGIDDPFAVGTVTLTTRGLSAAISSPDGDWNVAPLVQGAGVTAHASYFFSNQFTTADQLDFHDDEHLVAGGATPTLESGPAGGPDLTFTIGTQLKTLRLVIGTSAEWTSDAGGQAAAFALVTSMVASANTAFMRDAAVQLQLVSNTSTIFTNAATDGYTNGNTNSMATENQTIMDATYQFANYDVGQAFGVGGSGVAFTYGGGVGNVGSNIKATAASQAAVNTTPMTLRFIHEMGHQLGASHTWNDISAGADSGRSADSAFEPGPGSTLLSYGGLGWTGNFVTLRDPVFHNRSIDQMNDGVRLSGNGVAAGSVSNTGNIVPQVTAPADRTIPANTPFELTAAGYDNSPTLTYAWEQFDLGNEKTTGSDDGTGPIIRSRPATASPTRMFPELADVLANTIDPEEMLPTVARTTDPLTFHVTMWDQLGGVNDDSVNLPVVNTGSAFSVTTANVAGTTWAAGSTQTISWNVAGTTANGINTAKVDIFISYDGGTTFSPMWLDTNNDGSESVTIPANAPSTGTARIKVKARDNYFFDINNAAITITGTNPLNGLPTIAPIWELPLYGGPAGDVADVDLPLMSANASIDSAGDTDTYLFSPTVTAGYIITTGRVGSTSVDTVLSVYDDLSGAPIAINDDNGGTATSQVVVGMEAGKLYRISVGEYQSNDTGDVFLSIQGTVLAPTVPTTLNAQGDGTATGTLTSGRSAAYHTFVVPSTSDGTGTITYSAPNSSLVASLYDASRNLIKFSSGGSMTGITGLTPGSTYTLRIGVVNYAQGGGNYSAAINLTAAATPVAPDLFSISDLGVSNTDNITSQNTDVTFLVFGTVGTYMRLFRNGVLIDGPTAVTNLGYIALRDNAPTQGTINYTATAALTASSTQTPASAALPVTYDFTAPVQNFFSFRYDDGPSDHKMFVDFDDTVYDFAAYEPIVKNLTTNQTLSSSSFRIDNFGQYNDYYYDTTSANDQLPDGNYEITIPAGAAIDLAGNGNAQQKWSFYALAADANRDRKVDTVDFNVLAGYFGSSGRVFSTGNFNYSAGGLVDSADFNTLVGVFGKKIPAPAPDLGVSPSGGSSRPASLTPTSGPFSSTRVSGQRIDELQ